MKRLPPYQELIESVASLRFVQTKVNAKILVDSIFEMVADQAFGVVGPPARKRFPIPNFGVFSMRSRKARKVINPATGKAMHLPKQESLGFRASKCLRRVA